MKKIYSFLTKYQNHLVSFNNKKNNWIFSTQLIIVLGIITAFTWKSIVNMPMATWAWGILLTGLSINWFIWTIITFKEFMHIRNMELVLISEITDTLYRIKKDILFIQDKE